MFKLGLGLAVSIFTSVAIADDYQDWLQSQSSQYNQYKKSLDEEFSDMLKKDWEAFQSMSTPSPYKKPKPIELPRVVKPIITPKQEIKKSPIVVVEPIKKTVIPETIQEIEKVKKIKDFYEVNFDFYSTPIVIQYDKNTQFELSSIDKNSISKFWDMMSKTNYNKLIQQINIEKEKLSLNDWAEYQFIYKLGLNIFKDSNSANLFTWFTLVKMGYDSKVGYSNDTIYLMSTIQQNLFQVAFFTLNKKKYYILTPNGKNENVGSIYTYAGDYPKATNELSFNITKELKLYNHLTTKSLNFKYNNQNYTINTQYSKDLVEFYKSFPQTDYTVYFSTQNSTPLSNSLLVKLAPLVKGKSEIEAVNLLLRFVQTSFKYKTDQTQFNHEKVMFPEETINYPYSDCEDRSILFSYLVRNLLNLEVIGVKYNDHLATAVALSSNISGDSFKYKNKQYTIADATYVNSNAGMSMPKYKNSNFKIIALR
ncbi:MAG: hypothetical protein WBG69_00250 [Arcobacteraceae bacterium]